jgi:hypothetical protein
MLRSIYTTHSLWKQKSYATSKYEQSLSNWSLIQIFQVNSIFFEVTSKLLVESLCIMLGGRRLNLGAVMWAEWCRVTIWQRLPCFETDEIKKYSNGHFSNFFAMYRPQISNLHCIDLMQDWTKVSIQIFHIKSISNFWTNRAEMEMKLTGIGITIIQNLISFFGEFWEMRETARYFYDFF